MLPLPLIPELEPVPVLVVRASVAGPAVQQQCLYLRLYSYCLQALSVRKSTSTRAIRQPIARLLLQNDNYSDYLVVPQKNSNYRIMPALAERLATQDTFYRHPGSAQRSIFLYRVARVFRAGRFKSARRWQKRRDHHLVNAKQIKNQKLHIQGGNTSGSECAL